MKISSISATEGSQEQTELWQIAHQPWTQDILPSAEALARANASFTAVLPEEGNGYTATKQHLFDSIIPALNGSSLSANYYGFVIGGVTPAALVGDMIASVYDQNVSTHLPDTTVATDLEQRALTWLLNLLDLDVAQWSGRTFTTGATASNVLGLALGREYVLQAAAKKNGGSGASVGEVGIWNAMIEAQICEIQILTSLPHSSLVKAASIVGLGRSSVKTICRKDNPVKVDFELLEQYCAKPNVVTIVALAAGEVNTGHFDTAGLAEFGRVRQICDKYGAWLHVDGAFGLFASLLPADNPAYATVRSGVDGIHLADSITSDCHKFLNVPYDCGLFFSRHGDLAPHVFQNANAAYLATSGPPSGTPSPLNIGMENSRRFRALPVYATLHAYGRSGHVDMMERHVELARAVTSYLLNSGSSAYEVLSPGSSNSSDVLDRTFTIVLFRARESSLNATLVSDINATGKMYVSPSAWDGKPAARLAVSNWRVDVDRDLELIQGVLDEVAKASRSR